MCLCLHLHLGHLADACVSFFQKLIILIYLIFDTFVFLVPSSMLEKGRNFIENNTIFSRKQGQEKDRM